MNAASPPIRTLIVAHLRADPRKTGVLVMLTVVMAVFYGRWFWGDTPAEAEAQMAGMIGVTPVAGSESAGGVPTAPVAADSSRKRVALPRPIARELQNDPFALDLNRFPAGRDEEPRAPTTAPPQNGEDPIEAAAKALILQSTVSGRSPLACINGEFVRPGQRVSGFVLQQIEPTRVVLAREGVQVELFLK